MITQENIKGQVITDAKEAIERLEQITVINPERKRVSAKYRHVDSNELIQTVSNTLVSEGFGDASFKLTMPKGKRSLHLMEYGLGGVSVDLFDSKTYPRILLKNSFNGESSLQVMVGLFRLVCSNGLIIGDSFFNSKLIHLQGETIEQGLKELQNNIIDAIHYVQGPMKNNMENSLNIAVNPNQGIEIVKQLQFSKRLTETIVNQIESRSLRIEDSENNLWSLYNIINENMRLSSRSLFANELKNVRLMDNVIEVANQVLVAA